MLQMKLLVGQMGSLQCVDLKQILVDLERVIDLMTIKVNQNYNYS